MDRRVLYILMKLVGLDVMVYMKTRGQVSSKNVDVYEGNFYSGTIANGGINIMLRNARKRKDLKEPEGHLDGSQLISELMIHGKDILRISADNVDMSFGSGASVSQASLQKINGFRTDSEISSSIEFGRPRKLQRWTFDGVDGGEFGELEGSLAHPVEWDQFATNETRFGIKASFREEMYTTLLDRNSEEYRTRLAVAERIAREIEGSKTTDIHIAEERGQLSLDNIENEEQLYSSVVRGSEVTEYSFSKKYDIASSSTIEPASSGNELIAPKSEPDSKKVESAKTMKISSHLNPNAPEFKPPTDSMFGPNVLEEAGVSYKFLSNERSSRPLNKGPLRFYASKFTSQPAVNYKVLGSSWPSPMGISYKMLTTALPMTMGLDHLAFQDQATFAQSMFYAGQMANHRDYNFNAYPGFLGGPPLAPSFASSGK